MILAMLGFAKPSTVMLSPNAAIERLCFLPSLSANADHFVIYYRDGRVPQPGIILVGRVTDDVSIFDRPGPITLRVERIK